jgi:hypothetical protein
MMLTVDHMKLVTRQPRELKKLRRCLLGVQKGETRELAVMQENNGSCCDREPWAATLHSITEALKIRSMYVALVPEA